MTTITFSLSEDDKARLIERAARLHKERGSMLGISDLCRLAIFHQERANWKEIPEAYLGK